MKKFKTILAFCFLTVSALLVGCSKDDSSSSSNNSGYYYDNMGNCVSNNGSSVNPTYCQNGGNGGYYMGANGQCMNNMGQQVNYTLCQNSNNGGYYMGNNGQCYNNAGQQVNYQLCQNGGGNVGGAYQVCYGYFIYNNQYVYCNGANCAGYTLVSAQNGQSVRCQ